MQRRVAVRPRAVGQHQRVLDRHPSPANCLEFCLGTIAELWLAGHTKQPIQFLPFVLCALGLAAVIAALLRPSRSTLWALRFVMGIAAFGSLIGLYEHITSNLEVVLEVRPNAAMLEALWEAMRGAAPLLAPGILALAAITAIAATYDHPLLEKSSQG